MVSAIRHTPNTGANAPGTERHLVFSPEVGRSITEDTLWQTLSDNPAEHRRLLERIENFGSVDLTVRQFKLTGTTVETAGVESLTFVAD